MSNAEIQIRYGITKYQRKGKEQCLNADIMKKQLWKGTKMKLKEFQVKKLLEENKNLNDKLVEEYARYYRLAECSLKTKAEKEQIIFDLEKRLRYLLQSKTIQEYDEVDIHTKEYVKDIHSLDANIEHLNEWNKELTEENERLRAENEILKMKRANIFEISNAFERGRADGVRKMQEQLKMEIRQFGREGCSVSKEVIFWFIDQIAKEMLEGRNGIQ